MIELEIFIVFFTSIFFTLVYLMRRELLWGVFCYGAWQTLALMWLFIVPMETSYVIAWFFQGLSVIFLLMTVVDWLDKLRHPHEPSDLD